MGRTTPRALDGVVDDVVKQSEEQSKNSKSISESQTDSKGGEGGSGKGENGMQTFFTKVRGSSALLFDLERTTIVAMMWFVNHFGFDFFFFSAANSTMV